MEYLGKIGLPVINLIAPQVAYVFNYRQNLDELNIIIKDLVLAKERVDRQCYEAEKNLLNIEGNVTEWLRKVKECEDKVADFWNDEGHRKTQSLNVLLFPYLWNRNRLGRQAKEITEHANKVIEESSKFKDVAYRQNVTSNDVTLSNADYLEFGSRKSTMEDIMTQLEDSTVRMIGLHGPGGVGKSTLIKAIYKQVTDKKLFDVVAIADITANPNLQKIQEEIAYVLGLRLEGEGVNVRADCLRRRLKKENENTLVILDDLWDRLDLNMLGIPLDDDTYAPEKSARIPHKSSNSKQETVENQDGQNALMSKRKNELGFQQDLNKGCKILLTSRDKNVLSDKMNVKTIFSVQELDLKDALTLFQKVAGMPGEISDSRQEIVKKYCAGLPMAIVTVGRALRGKSSSVVEATLEKLKNEDLVGVQKSMEISLRMSYDHLENEELKSIFLLSAQMGHQSLNMDLVKYCYGLGILGGVYSLKEARERIRTSIKKLKHSSLMLDESSDSHFNMHDMVRDAALSIAHKDQNVFTLRNGKLDDWPELERCTSISICNSDIIHEFPRDINCPQLKFFQIDSDDPSLKIPESFFKRMKKLRVLILTGIHLESLPSSIRRLSNLRMLCLERCTLDGDLSNIGELKKLRILSFSGSLIENLPDKLGCLDKLQLLDISNCSIKKMIPPNFISRLTSLEELYIGKSLIKILVEGETNRSQISFLSPLHQLKVMDLSIPCITVLPENLFFDKLNDYKIVIGDFKMLSVEDFSIPGKYEALRSLELQLEPDPKIHFQNGIKLLFKSVQNLLLGELNGVQNVIDELNLDGFPDLIHLYITNNDDIKYINSMDLSHSRDVFPKLESLCLDKLENIEMICRSPVTIDSFAKLKTIKVKMCTNLKNLFSFYMVKVLASVETIDVSECPSLNEIVEIPENLDKVEFAKLNSLTLQSLPSFTNFYTSVMGPSVPKLTEAQITKKDDKEVISDMATPLFGELVEILNLESLYLSSININKIWSNHQPSSFCFQNLLKLDVKGCDKLKYLCSLSVACALKKLKALFLSECPLMEKIFETEGNRADKVCVFPKLEELHLSEMNMLTDIWHAEVSADSFSSLMSVHIDSCKKLGKIFPSHMEGWFASLNSLKVAECKSVEVIFEIKDSQQVDAYGGIDTNLQLISVSTLPNLKQVWSRDPGGILDFKKLCSVEVSSCDKLRNVFPASVAKDLRKLEYMSVGYCNKMVEIVVCEDGSESNNEPLVFPELTYMKLDDLPYMKRFYTGRHTIECTKLKRLEVGYCGKLKTFPTETSQSTNEENPVFSAEVIPNLEIMQIDFDQAQEWLLINTEKYQMHRLKELRLSCGKSAGLILWKFLYRIPNLEKLSIFFGWNRGLTELVPSANVASQERLGTVLQLKELVLSGSEIKDLGFEREPVLQRLELLRLHYCNKLSNLAPPSVSLAYLTNLEVMRCRGLRNLMASSTAESLVQLKSMKVTHCDNVKEILTNEGNEEDQVIEIEFRKLITIELVSLKNLESFCNYKNCEFKFPSLEIFIVKKCPMMKTFSEGRARAPKLQNIVTVEGQEKAKRQWIADLNAPLQKVFQDELTYVENLELSYYPEFIEKLWHGNHLMQPNNFDNLKRLEAYGCNSLVHVIPSHLLPCFKNLEELKVRNCSAVQVIFNISDDIRPETKAMRIIRLKKLSLEDLPKLRHIWDKDPEGIIGFQVLQNMSVKRCGCLNSLFPASVAKDLNRLEVFSVTECKELIQIFSKNEKAAEGAKKEFVFRRLTSLTLKELPRLKYFYPGLHTLNFPVLKELDVVHWGLVKLKCQEDHPEEHVPIQIAKVIQMDQIPSLKKLSIGIGDTDTWWVTWDRESARQLQFDKLKRFQEDSDSATLYTLLNILCTTIDKVAFHQCSFEEIFFVKRPNADYTRILLHLKGLQVKDCSSLKIYLVPSTVSFSNLTYLKVSECQTLIYLFRSSTAKSLSQLKKMEIKHCESLEEIVSREGDETHEDKQIMFEQLQVLYLKELHKLRCFYPGDFTLCFPSLEQVYVIDCNWMYTFSPFNKIDSTKWFSAKYGSPQQECDLNSAARRRFEVKLSKSSDLTLKDSPILQEIWHGSQSIPHTFFSKLKSFTVDRCQFLSDAVLPFHLLPFFAQLETLEVRHCVSVKTIFDVKCLTQDRTMTFSLENLTLSNLPNLENVWNNDPHGILRMRDLQKVSVDKCKRLTIVFPASVAKDQLKLENLVVEDCKELMEIVADQSGTNLEPTFSCPFVTSLKLKGLPKLNYFYYCWKTCTHPESHAEDDVCVEKEPLQCLSLGGNGLEMILRGEFPRNLLHKLKVLTLLFHKESDVFPYEILPQVPNIEKLVVCDDSFKEIFCSQSPNVTGILSQLKVLRLDSLEKLVSIASESSWIEPFLRNLETLQVENCHRLKNLVACTLSFSNLTYLEVRNCRSLVYLFTSSTAKSLAQLETMKIEGCGSIEEIVSTEGDESNEEIIFPQLNCLILENLQMLRSFYKGSLSFPSLEELTVICCDRMETLCAGTLKAEKLLQVKLDFNAIEIKIDLKSTMREASLEELSETSFLTLKDRPILQEIWHGSLSIPDSCFSNLQTLIVDRCQFLSDAVLPFHLLPFFTQLETLEVRHCVSVKTIFDVKCPTQDIETTTMVPFALNKLILEQLPNLENVWNSDPKGTNHFLTFSSVKSLALCDLPKFKYFWQCDMLKTFTHPEPHTENQVCIEKLTPNLEHLRLGENELKMILRGELQVPNIEKLEVCDGYFKEIFCFHSLNVDEAGLLSQLKVLCLDSLPELVSIGSEISWIVPFLRNLEILEVMSRFSSINLVPCTASFSKLTHLEVARCNSLLYLFTSSTAKSLAQLKTMKIQSCDSIEEIVSKEGDESHENEIIFQQLNCLNLVNLQILRSFYEGSLSFPSLDKLSVINCHRMETFCAGTVEAEKLLRVEFHPFQGAIPLETDLNSVMQNR